MQKSVFFGNTLHFHRLVVYVNVLLSLLYIVGLRFSWLHRLNSVAMLVSLVDLLLYGAVFRAQPLKASSPPIRSLYYIAAALLPVTAIDLLFGLNPGTVVFGLSPANAEVMLEVYYFNINLVAFCINLWFLVPSLNSKIGKGKYLVVILVNVVLYALFLR